MADPRISDLKVRTTQISEDAQKIGAEGIWITSGDGSTLVDACLKIENLPLYISNLTVHLAKAIGTENSELLREAFAMGVENGIRVAKAGVI